MAMRIFLESLRYDPSSTSTLEMPDGSDLQGVVNDEDVHIMERTDSADGIVAGPDDLLHHLTDVGVETSVRRRQYVHMIRTALFVLLVVSVCVAVLGIASALGAFRLPHEKQQQQQQPLPEPPQRLETVCALSNLQTDQGYEDCLNLCQPAQCCDILATDNPFSCLASQRSKCETYRASCQHLHHKRASDNSNKKNAVNVVCSTESLGTPQGVASCQQLCDGFACCFDGSTHCDVSDAWCHEYGACATMHVLVDHNQQNGVPSKETIDQACQDIATYAQQTTCTHVCNPGLCCFLSPNSWQHDCHVNCTHYDACSVLYGYNHGMDKDDDVHHSIPHELEQSCSPGRLQTLHGARECLEVCQHHLCCFRDDDHCLSSNSQCSLYSACGVLLEQDPTRWEPLEQACSAVAIQTDGPKPCVDACSDHLCCLFDARFEASCNDAFDNDLCHSKNRPCSILAPEEPPQEDPDLLSLVDLVCTESNLASTLGFTECETVCMERACCIERGAGSCLETDVLYCSQVKACQLMFWVEPGSNEQTTTKTKNAITQVLQHKCGADSISTLAGYHNCYDECFFHLCCFNNDDNSGDCHEECDLYQPCAILFERDDDEYADVQKACTAVNVETKSGLLACRKGCAQHMCCLQAPNLPSSCVDRCQEGHYDPCAVLVSNTSHSVYNIQDDPYLLALIAHYCTAESVAQDRSLCEENCSKRSCCFQQDGCYQNNPSWCQEIASCQILYENTTIPLFHNNTTNNATNNPP